VRAPWVGRIYGVTITRYQTLRSHTQFYPHRLPGEHQAVNLVFSIIVDICTARPTRVVVGLALNTVM